MPTLHTTRYRSGGDLADREYYHRLRDPSGNVVFETTGNYPSFTRFNDIYDNVNRRVNGFYPDTDCASNQITSRLIDRLPSYNEDFGFTVEAIKYPPYCTPESVLGMLPEFSSSHWDSFFYDAFLEFAMQIPEEISSYNFLWEGREISSLIPRLEESISKTVSGGYLNLEFGWKPFLSDIMKLSNMVSIVEKRLQHLIEINGKTTRLSTVRKDVQSIPAIRPWVPILGPWEMRLRSYRADLRASGRLYVDLKGLKSEAAFWRAAAVALGLTNPLKAFWESIPFSFMADWFNQIGARTFNLTVNPFEGRYEVSRLNTSLSETAVVDFRFNYKSSLNPVVTIGSFAVKRYHRYAGFPAQPSIFNIDALSPKQQTLMLALINSAR